MSLSDYQQPDFFRFGWDQLLLVKTILQHTRLQTIDSLIELGAGSGVIACELSRGRSVQAAHLVEYQQEDWEPYLRANLEHFGCFKETSLHWCKVSEFNLKGHLKVPLVVSNPPYFLPQAGKRAIDPRRDIAHRFVVDSPQDWVDAMVRSLLPGGEAWWLHRDPGPPGTPIFPSGMRWEHVIRSGRMRVIRLTGLNIE